MPEPLMIFTVVAIRERKAPRLCGGDLMTPARELVFFSCAKLPVIMVVTKWPVQNEWVVAFSPQLSTQSTLQNMPRWTKRTADCWGCHARCRAAHQDSDTVRPIQGNPSISLGSAAHIHTHAHGASTGSKQTSVFPNQRMLYFLKQPPRKKKKRKRKGAGE